MRRKVGPKESSVKRLPTDPRETNESRKSAMRQPKLSQRRPLTYPRMLRQRSHSENWHLGAWGEVINSLLREVIWCIWVCAVGEQ